MKNFCEDLFFFFFFGDRLKNFCEDLFFFFFLESTCALCPWSLALASSIPVLGLESVCPRKGCPWPWPRIFFVSLALALASSLVSSTPPLVANTRKSLKFYRFESARILVSLISLNFFLVCFAAEAGSVFNLFLNFEQK